MNFDKVCATKQSAKYKTEVLHSVFFFCPNRNIPSQRAFMRNKSLRHQVHPQSAVRGTRMETRRERRGRRQGGFGRTMKKPCVHVGISRAPGVRDTEIHNAAIILHNLNKSEILTSPLSGKRLMPRTSGMCL